MRENSSEHWCWFLVLIMQSNLFRTWLEIPKIANDVLFVKCKLEEIQGYFYIMLTCIPVCFLDQKREKQKNPTVESQVADGITHHFSYVHKVWMSYVSWQNSVSRTID